MSKDYRQSNDYELEDEYRMNPNDEDVYRELNNRGYEEVDGELLDEYEYADYKEERERRNVRGKEESGVASLAAFSTSLSSDLSKRWSLTRKHHGNRRCYLKHYRLWRVENN